MASFTNCSAFCLICAYNHHSARLTSQGSGVAEDTIIFSCDEEACVGVSAGIATTDSGGHYSVRALLGNHKSTHKVYIDGRGSVILRSSCSEGTIAFGERKYWL